MPYGAAVIITIIVGTPIATAVRNGMNLLREFLTTLSVIFSAESENTFFFGGKYFPAFEPARVDSFIFYTVDTNFQNVLGLQFKVVSLVDLES